MNSIFVIYDNAKWTDSFVENWHLYKVRLAIKYFTILVIEKRVLRYIAWNVPIKTRIPQNLVID